MTDPPVIADVALLVSRRFGAPLVVVSQDVFPEVAVELKRLDNPVVVAALRYAIRFYLQRADRVVAIGETMRTRLAEKGADPGNVVVIPNWVDVDALVATRAGQRLGARARARRSVRRHALGQHRARPESRLADPRGDVPARPRRPTDRADRRRRASPGAEGSRAPARSGAGALLRLPATRGPARVALERRRPRRRPREGALRLRRAEPAVRDPRRRPARDRRGRRRERDRAGRPGGGGCGVVVPPGPSGAPRRSDPQCARRRARSGVDGARRGASTSAGQIASSRSGATARSCATSSGRTGGREQTGRGHRRRRRPGRRARSSRSAAGSATVAPKRSCGGCERVLVAIGPLDNPTLALVPVPDRIPVPRLSASQEPGCARGCFDADGRVVEAIDRRQGDAEIWSLREDPTSSTLRRDRAEVDRLLLRMGVPARLIDDVHERAAS